MKNGCGANIYSSSEVLESHDGTVAGALPYEDDIEVAQVEVPVVQQLANLAN